MRLRARVDANQTEIVKVFRQLGCSVAFTHQLGGGIGDIIVGKNGKNVLVEIKDGSKPPSQQKLTKDEVKFHDEWRGWIVVIASADDAMNLVKEMGDE